MHVAEAVPEKLVKPVTEINATVPDALPVNPMVMDVEVAFTLLDMDKDPVS